MPATTPWLRSVSGAKESGGRCSSQHRITTIIPARFFITFILTILACQLLDPSPPAIFNKRTLRKLLATHHVRLRDPASIRAARRYWKRTLNQQHHLATTTTLGSVDFQLVRPFKPQGSNEGERWSSAVQDDRVIRYAEGLTVTPPQPKAVDGGLVTVDGKPIITDALVEVQLLTKPEAGGEVQPRALVTQPREVESQLAPVSTTGADVTGGASSTTTVNATATTAMPTTVGAAATVQPVQQTAPQ